MSVGSTPGLSGLRFVNPQRAAAMTYAAVPAGRPMLALGTPAPNLLAQGSPVPTLDVAIPGQGRLWTLTEWIHETYSTSLLVVNGGVVVYEWYAEGLGPSDLYLGASMTKSALGHLVGRAVADGAMGLGSRVVEHVPELADSGYVDCTVEHLLTMTTGVDWVEDHRDPNSLASRLLACFTGSAGGSRDLLRSVRPRDRPGTRFEYCTDRDAAARRDRRGTQGSRPRLGRPLVDTVPAVPRAGATAEHHLDACRVRLPLVAAGRRRSPVTADGSRGQFAYADRDLGIVVVKTSQWPYADFLVDRRHRDLSYLGLPLIARAATKTCDLDARDVEREQEA